MWYARRSAQKLVNKNDVIRSLVTLCPVLFPPVFPVHVTQCIAVNICFLLTIL